MTIEIRKLGRDFAGVAAVDEVSFTAEAGKITALIGPNGAGKTTLINLMSGHLKPSRGDVLLGEKPVTGLAPHRRAQIGVSRTFQHSRVFHDMSVMENVMLGQHAAKLRGRREQHSAARTALRHFGLEEVSHRAAENLSHGEQRRVELARALVPMPRVLLLDEPAAGLSGEERSRLKEDLLSIVSPDLAIVLVEHDLELVMSLADFVIVVDFGTVIAAGQPKTVVADPKVQEAYMGSVSD